MPTLYLIDGNAYMHRAYHALPPLSTSKGEMVNAVYGFIRMLLKILKARKPEHVAVCFDYPAPTFRHEHYSAYKANRKAMDAELKSQMPLAREAVRILGLPLVEMKGFEADDLIATMARKAEKDGAKTVIITADKDALQLVNGSISVWNESKDIWYDPAKVEEKYGLAPDKLTDMFALMGDATDNVPGIRGVGEKTAVKFIQKYGSVEALIAHADSLEGRWKDIVQQGRDDALNSKHLVTLHENVPVAIPWSECRPAERDEKTVIDFLRRLEFTSLLKEIMPEKETSAPEGPVVTVKDTMTFAIVSTEKAARELFDSLKTARRLSVDLETTGTDPRRASLVGISLAVTADKAWYIPVGHAGAENGQLPLAAVISSLKQVLEDPKIPKYGHNIKYDQLVLSRYGIEMNGLSFDTMIASYCLNPSRQGHGLKAVTLDYLGQRMTEIQELIGRGAKQITMDQVPVEKAAAYAAADAVAVLRLAEKFAPELEKQSLLPLFRDVEMPLVGVLAEMERTGIKVDLPYLTRLAGEFSESLRTIEEDLYRLAGETFNPNSPKQLAVILFEKLKLPVQRRTKTGYCTDEEVLRTLSSFHALPGRLIEYRELQKLSSTYIDALMELADPDTHRVHSSFNQAVTATGRLSSSDPNMQNIPIRSEYGKKIRRAFVPEKGYALISADYSQIDLRVLAHVSGDAALTEAFKRGEDIHTATAREVFSSAGGEITTDLRRIAKSINFGIVYGMSPYGLAQQLKITNEEAKEYIRRYFERYPGVAAWIERIIKQAKRTGRVETLLGRIRYLPEINSPNGQIRGFAERTAMNTPIQGTSADIIKLAMVFNKAGRWPPSGLLI